MNTLNLPAFASFNQAQRALFTVALSGCSTIPQRMKCLAPQMVLPYVFTIKTSAPRSTPWLLR